MKKKPIDEYNITQDKKIQVYNYLVWFWGTYGISPSRRDITEGCDLLGDHAGDHIRAVLRAMEEDGTIILAIGGKISRNIVLVGARWYPPGVTNERQD